MKELKHDETRGDYSLIRILGITALALLTLLSVAGAAPYAYVANMGSHTVSVIDVTNNNVIATVPVGWNPFGVAASPDGSKVYVTNEHDPITFSKGSVSVIDTATNTVTNTVLVGKFPCGVAVSPDGSKVYVTNSLDNNVSIIDTATNTVTSTVNVESYPKGVAVTPDGSKVYVTNYGTVDNPCNNISVIDTSSNTVVATVSIFSLYGAGPSGIAVTPDGSKAYVANLCDSSVSIIDTAREIVIDTIVESEGLESGPSGVTVSPDGSKVYVTSAGPDHIVSVIDTTTNDVTNMVKVGTLPKGLAVTPDGTKVYVTNLGSDNVSVIDTAANAVTGTVSVGSYPVDIAFGQFTDTVPTTNTAPVADAGESYQANESAPVTFTASLSNDPDGDALQYRWDFESDGVWDTEWSNDQVATHTWNDNWSGSTTLEVSDGELNSTDTATVIISNVNPTLGKIISPIDPASVNTPIQTNCTFADAGLEDTHTGIWDWGDGTNSSGVVSETNGAGTITGEHVYTNAGVYWVNLTVMDDDGGSAISIAENCTVVYNPEGGFVTGGGWINSPAGAYVKDEALTGKATFGFVSKYEKGAVVPTGKTEFQFKVANLNFKSTSYDWLVIAGSQAKYKGTGTINGEGNYGFMLSAVDGDNIDKFRIKIWDKDLETENIIYDNEIEAAEDSEPSTSIGGGSIVIHKEK